MCMCNPLLSLLGIIKPATALPRPTHADLQSASAQTMWVQTVDMRLKPFCSLYFLPLCFVLFSLMFCFFCQFMCNLSYPFTASLSHPRLCRALHMLICRARSAQTMWVQTVDVRLTPLCYPCFLPHYVYFNCSSTIFKFFFYTSPSSSHTPYTRRRDSLDTTVSSERKKKRKKKQKLKLGWSVAIIGRNCTYTLNFYLPRQYDVTSMFSFEYSGCASSLAYVLVFLCCAVLVSSYRSILIQLYLYYNWNGLRVLISPTPTPRSRAGRGKPHTTIHISVFISSTFRLCTSGCSSMYLSLGDISFIVVRIWFSHWGIYIVVF